MRSSAAALLCAVALAAASPPAARAEVVERILATVEERPVMLSEVQTLARLRGIDADAALEALIDERLMFREAARLPQAAVDAAAEERALESLRQRAGAAAAELDQDELRRLARREAVILKYLDFRFLPQVRIDDEEVRQAYEKAYGSRPEAPSFESVAADLRQRLQNAQLDQKVEAWVKELRAEAAIRYNR